MDVAYYQCPDCELHISAHAVRDPGFMLRVEAHKADHEAGRLSREAEACRSRAHLLRERAAEERLKAGITPEEG